MFAYCINNPVMYVDFGATDISSATKQEGKNFVEYLNEFVNQVSNAYTTFVSMCDGALRAVSDYAISGIQSAERPANIGKGTFAKNQVNAIDDVNLFKNTGSKILNKLAYIGVLIDAGVSTVENVTDNASYEKIVWDITVDAALTGFNIWASAKIGGAVGSFIGGPIGSVFGAATGIGASVAMYWGTDYIQIDGLSLRKRLKGAIS